MQHASVYLHARVGVCAFVKNECFLKQFCYYKIDSVDALNCACTHTSAVTKHTHFLYTVLLRIFFVYKLYNSSDHPPSDFSVSSFLKPFLDLLYFYFQVRSILIVLCPCCLHFPTILIFASILYLYWYIRTFFCLFCSFKFILQCNSTALSPVSCFRGS